MVNLGAGMDPNACFIPGIDEIRCCEFDLPDVVKRKREAVERTLGGLPAHVTHVGVDLNVQYVEADLVKSGCDKTSWTPFILESVSAHLAGETNEAVFGFVGKAPRGSKRTFSCATQALPAGEGLDNRGAK